MLHKLMANIPQDHHVRGLVPTVYVYFKVHEIILVNSSANKGITRNVHQCQQLH